MVTQQSRLGLSIFLFLSPFAAACGGGSAGGGGATSDIPAGDALRLGQTVSGDTVSEGDDVEPSCSVSAGAGDESWAFVPEESGVYRFHVVADYDSVIAVRADGAEVGCNDDGENKRESVLEVTLAAGQAYQVVVDGFQGAEGTYLITTTQVSGGAIAPEGVTGVLALNTPVTGDTRSGEHQHRPSCGSGEGTPENVWHFVPTQTGQHVMHVAAEFDSVVAVYDSNNNELGCNDDAGNTRTSELTVPLQAGQAYSVVVDGYSTNSGTYTLAARFGGAGGPVPTPIPPNNTNTPPTPNGGGTITLGQTVSGNTQGGSDRRTPSCGARPGTPDDQWQFTSTQAGAFRVHVDSQYDAVLALYDDQGVEIACNDDNTSTSDSELIMGLATGRTYTIVVDGFGAGTGAYTLTVDQPTGMPALPTTGIVVPPTPTGPPQPAGVMRLRRAINDTTIGSTNQFTPSCGSDSSTPDDVWEFTPRRRGAYRFDVTSDYDGVLAIYDSNRTEIDCNDDHTSTRDSRVLTRLRARQTYYVVVDSYGSNPGGTYQLRAVRQSK